MNSPDSVCVRPIGYIKSCFKEKFGTPRQGYLAPSATASFELIKGYRSQGMLEGLDGFSHLWLVFLFHANTNKTQPGKIRPPRLGGKSIGVLASRSPHRPNPIGLSLVKLDKVKGDRLELSGVDLIDGTPILDIKPYVHESDSVENSSQGWLNDVSTPLLSVEFSESFFTSLDQIGRSSDEPQLCQLIRESLQQDPRPQVYRDLTKARPEAIKPHYGYFLYDLNVQFVYTENGILVVGVSLTES